MASIPITITGVMFYTDVGVGGGPMPGGPGPGSGPPNWSPIHPSHPIANPWPPYVDAGPPGPQPRPPSWSPVHPSHPIANPWPPYVDAGPPGPQPPPGLGIWPNPPEGSVLPEHPIVLPPDLPPTMPPPDERPIDWKTAWTPQTGWIVIGVPSGAHPTPSK